MNFCKERERERELVENKIILAYYQPATEPNNKHFMEWCSKSCLCSFLVRGRVGPILTDAGIATAGTSDSSLKTSHLTRAHQLTCVALNILQKKLYQLAKDDNNRIEVACVALPYWDTILNIHCSLPPNLFSQLENTLILCSIHIAKATLLCRSSICDYFHFILTFLLI